jgi:hypothetical protein
MSRGRLIAATLGALALAALIVFGAILPAEFNKDFLGVGRLTGIARLWAPAERTVDKQAGGALARESDRTYRTDVIEIPLGGFLTGSENSELEYKVRMRKGEALIYSWSVEGDANPDDIHFDQHGHTTPKAGEEMTVASYRQGSGLQQNGALTAPFDGIQGWQFSNFSEQPVVIRVKLAGFYDLIPGGQAGNEASVFANVPAAQARPSAPAALKAKP